MPAAFSKPCQMPGCQQLTTKGHYCRDHYKSRRTAYDHRRGSSAQRGYGGRWQRYREQYFADPEHALCVLCLLEGRTTLAEHIDHKIPADPDSPLFWDPTNHQPLCKPCHSRKTVERDHGFGRAPTK
jgi:5-methylcytosine-specific restriction protein A